MKPLKNVLQPRNHGKHNRSRTHNVSIIHGNASLSWNWDIGALSECKMRTLFNAQF